MPQLLGTAEGPSETAAFALGGVQPLGAVQLCLVPWPAGVPSGQLGFIVIPWWSISAPRAENWSGPSREQTLSSGHLPFEAFQKGERALKTEKLLEIGLLTNKN